MSYRCRACCNVVKAGTPRLTYAFMRSRFKKVDGVLTRLPDEIAKEIPVCATCKEDLGKGVSIAELAKRAPKDLDRQLGITSPAPDESPISLAEAQKLRALETAHAPEVTTFG